jgi:RNA chaperone Hfq
VGPASLSDEAYIEFIPRAPDSWRSAPEGRRGPGLPPEALGRWPRPAAGRTGTAPPVRRARPWTPGPSGASPPAAPAQAPASAGTTVPAREGRSAAQDDWLQRMRRAGVELEIRCLAGPALRGRLVDFDAYALLLEQDGETVLVFKHGVVAIRPVVRAESAPLDAGDSASG